MPTFVVATRGTSLKEMHNTMAYLIEAEDLGHAKALAMADQCEGQASEDVDGLIRDLLASYGNEWFVQLLNPDCTAGYVLKNKRDCPATGPAADLAPFTHPSQAKAVAAGKRGEYAYKR